MTKIYKDKHLLITANGILYKVSVDNILYVEKIKNSKKVKISTTSEEIECSGTIAELDSLLNSFQNFYKISQSTIINTDFITKVDNHQNIVILDTNIPLYFSNQIIKNLLNDVYGEILTGN